jgi:hypothetical protein
VLGEVEVEVDMGLEAEEEDGVGCEDRLWLCCGL